MTELSFHAYARSVLASVVADRSRRAHTRQIGARSDKEVLEEEGGGGGGEEPDPFVDTALHCMPQSKKKAPSNAATAVGLRGGSTEPKPVRGRDKEGAKQNRQCSI